MLRILIVFLILSFMTVYGQNAGYSLYFDGQDDYVESIRDIGISGNTPRTVTYWAKSAQPYTSKCCPTPLSWGSWYGGGGFGTFISIGQWWFWGYQNDVNTYHTVNTEWNHHCITYDSLQVKYYLNGKLVGSEHKSLNTAPSKLFIGDGFDHRADTPFNGLVDEIRIWKGVWTQEKLGYQMFRELDMASIFRLGPEIYWKFDEGHGNVTKHLLNISNDGILTNMDTSTTWVKSTLPRASKLSQLLIDLTAIWASVDSNSSSILSISDTTISGDSLVLFGHDNGDLVFDTTDVPKKFDIKQRLKRVWRVEMAGNVTGTVGFDLREFPNTDGIGYRLLRDVDGKFADADTMYGDYISDDSIFVVSSVTFKNGEYFTLGTTPLTNNIVENSIVRTPKTPFLAQNYPNPFNASTTIEFYLPDANHITLEIYNYLGQKIDLLLKRNMRAGMHSLRYHDANKASGIYFYRLQIDNKKSIIRKMILMR